MLQTPRWGHGYSYEDPRLGTQDNHAFYRHLQARVPLAWRDRDSAGFFGAWDPCGKPEVVEQWHEALPRMVAHTRVFPDHGHFIEEYRGPAMALAILAMNGSRSP